MSVTVYTAPDESAEPGRHLVAPPYRAGCVIDSDVERFAALRGTADILRIGEIAKIHIDGLTGRLDGAAYRVAVHLLDGLFVFDYFLEAFIWKFGNPFYRKTLGPLYLAR